MCFLNILSQSECIKLKNKVRARERSRAIERHTHVVQQFVVFTLFYKKVHLQKSVGNSMFSLWEKNIKRTFCFDNGYFLQLQISHLLRFTNTALWKKLTKFHFTIFWALIVTVPSPCSQLITTWSVAPATTLVNSDGCVNV